jgi:Rv0078B-related antitoxin
VDTTGAADRLRTAFELFEFGVAMKRQQLRRERPAANETEIDEPAMTTPAPRTVPTSRRCELRPLRTTSRWPGRPST